MGDRRSFVLAPKASRGLFTAWSRFSLGDFVDSFSSFRDTILRDGAWQPTRAPILVNLPAGTGPVWALWIYNPIDASSTTAGPTSVVLGHVGGTVNPIGGTATLYRYDNNASILATTAPHQLNFLTIKNRCFVAGLTLTGGTLPQVLTKYPSITNYNWGKAGPTAVLSYTPYSGLTDPGGGQDYPNLRIFFNAGGVGTGIDNGGGVVNWTCADSVFSFPGPPVWDGKTLVVNTLNSYKINTVSATNALTTTTSPATPPAPFVTAPYEVHYGQLTWTDQGPKYTYAYYNPTTGHATNAAPVMQVSEQNMSDVSVELTGIPVTNDPNYTRIIIFRGEVGAFAETSSMRPLLLDSAHGGSASIADGLIVNNGPGTVTYIDNQPNDLLGQVVGDVYAPPDDNDPPPSDIKFMEYWDGHVWLTTASEPWRLRFSRATDPNVLGIGEESFPARNFIDIPSNDGLVTAIKSVGAGLLIGTDRFMYSVEAGPYHLVKISSRGTGVGHFGIDDHPGDTTTGSASAIYISRDKRLWRHYTSGRLDDLGAPIQDKLDDAPFQGAGPVHKPYIVKVFNVGKNWFAAVGILDSVHLDAYNFYFMDFDTLTWHDLGFTREVYPLLSFASGIDFTNGAVGAALGGKNASQQIARMLHESSAPVTSTVTTQFMDMGDITAKKSLQEIVFYVNDETYVDWACAVRFDASTGAFTSLTQDTVSSTPAYRGAGIIRWSPRGVGVRQWSTIQLRMQIPGGTTTAYGKHFKAEVVYTMESTGEAGRRAG